MDELPKRHEDGSDESGNSHTMFAYERRCARLHWAAELRRWRRWKSVTELADASVAFTTVWIGCAPLQYDVRRLAARCCVDHAAAVHLAVVQLARCHGAGAGREHTLVCRRAKRL